MNKHLQSIIDKIQQAEHLSAEEKDALIKAVKEADKNENMLQFKLERMEKDRKTLSVMLEESIEDLQKKTKAVEEQNKELEIEAALEKVRGSAMSMHDSNDISATTSIVFTELRKLGIQSIRCGVGLLSKDSHMAPVYAATRSSDGEFHTLRRNIDMMEHSALAQQYETWLKQENHVTVLSGDELRSYYNLPFFHSSASYVPPEHHDHKEYGYYIPFTEGLFYAWTEKPYSEDEQNILNRFKTIIALTFRRYLDLKKAEAQAREAKIEAALERVRARTMAMHKSEELSEAAAVLFQQFKELGEEPERIFIATFDEVEAGVIDLWGTNQGGKQLDKLFKVPADEPTMVSKIVAAWREKKKSVVIDLSGEELERYMQFLKTSGIPVRGGVMTERRVQTVGCFSKGVIGITTSEPKPAEAIDLIERFAGVFNLTYTRFLDLLHAEAQAKEAQIEASLERVRGKTMAMHNSMDVGDTVATMFDQLVKLGITTNRCGILIFSDSNDTEVWTAKSDTNGEAKLIIGLLDVMIHPMLSGVRNAWKNKEQFFSYQLMDDDLKNYYGAINNYQGYPIRFNIDSLPSKEFHSDFFFPEGAVFAFTSEPITPEASQIFKRFAAVFGQTYRRYLDLQKAEAQTRESQIQLALERVRARTMAMYKSEELAETSQVLFQQLGDLGGVPDRISIGIVDEKNSAVNFWATDQTGSQIAQSFRARLNEPTTIAKAYAAWKDQQKFLVVDLSGQELADWVHFAREEMGIVVKDEFIKDRRMHHIAFFSHGWILVSTHEPQSSGAINILERFASVFNLTYRRFLDLQKAEAQAREAQIEASLERVRARTMAMHSSEDVSAATATMFTELEKLGIENYRGGITNIRKDETQEVWSVSNVKEGKVVKGVGMFDINAHPFWQYMYKEWLAKKESLHYYLAGKEKDDYVRILNTTQNYLPQSIQQFPDVHFAIYYFNEGAVWTNSLKPHSEEDKQVMKKFASVFSLTFRRYQDLKKAEEQAREATIEAALEKVRGKAMAMHNSNDLSVTASMVFTELRKLGINPIRCGVGLLNKESRKAQLYSAGDGLTLIGWVQLTDHPVLIKIYDTWLNNEEYYPELQGEQMRSYYELLLKGLPVTMPDTTNSPKQYGTFLPISVGCLYAWSEAPYNDSEIKILKRFASIIDLTFRRYIELQKSEANTKEAIKQATLDRVRAEIASMRTVADLDRITPLIWNELTVLGIPFIRCGVFLMDDSQQLIHTFLSTPDGKAIAAFHLPYDTPGNLEHVVRNWKKKKNYIDHWDEEEFTQFADMLVRQGALASAELYLKTIPRGGFHLHFLPFLQGMLYVGNTTQLGEEEIKLLQSVADAFSTAYSRYEDFNKLEAAKQQVEKTLTDLKQTQQQLVQSEKMASLGELTAGIAHEIQNPLNFVNNFSEVSNELIDEMNAAIAKGDTKEAKGIADDIKQNLEKINHHGKRADAIVKGMLQHSRTSSGQKELTDINVLTDEYLRLAFHGLRAKDKSFNAKFETDFDESIGKINVVPQDIGRVILNLINNAFYAVTERKKYDKKRYEPTVTISTVKENGSIEIRVRDNGTGIPQKVLDKIFQPFFTTKPTGQGTGLGLSLAYDIVKSHGGELKVETKVGEGTTFIIQLPVV